MNRQCARAHWHWFLVHWVVPMCEGLVGSCVSNFSPCEYSTRLCDVLTWGSRKTTSESRSSAWISASRTLCASHQYSPQGAPVVHLSWGVCADGESFGGPHDKKDTFYGNLPAPDSGVVSPESGGECGRAPGLGAVRLPPWVLD
jgi:hypothetical protein